MGGNRRAFQTSPSLGRTGVNKRMWQLGKLVVWMGLFAWVAVAPGWAADADPARKSPASTSTGQGGHEQQDASTPPSTGKHDQHGSGGASMMGGCMMGGCMNGRGMGGGH